MENAKKCPNPREESVDSFMHFSAIVSNMVVAMNSTNCKSYLENHDLIFKLEEKLPRSSRRAWAQIKIMKEQMKETVNLKTFADWLKSEVNLLISISTPCQFLQNKSTHWQKKERVFSIQKAEMENCRLCKNDPHRLGVCKMFLSMGVKERRKYAEDSRLCYRCLIPGHAAVKCYRKIYCNIGKCRGRHSRLLHVEPEEKVVDNHVEETSNFTGLLGRASSLLKIVKVKVYGAENEIETFALLDEGSTVTLVDFELANSIKLDGPTVPVCLQWTNEVTRKEENSKLVEFYISPVVNQRKKYRVRNARTIENLLLPKQYFDADYLCQKYKFIDRSILESVKNCRPTILIGQDNVFLMNAQEVIQPQWDAPAMSKTKLGWVVHGPYANSNAESALKINICQHDDTYLQKMIEEHLKLENDFDNSLFLSKDDLQALSTMQKTIKRVGNRFEIGLPWKNSETIFPETKMLATKRLNCMERKMDQDPQFASEYCKKIQDYVEKGYAELVTEENLKKDNGRIWYLPHFAVRNINKPGKIRFVFDAAAKSSNVSLNDFLLKGPDFYPLLVSILWRFREGKYAFSGDIRDMFHQIIIREEDRSSQRFLLRGLERNREPEVYQMRVMIFGAVCSPSIAQYVKNHNAEEFQEEFPDIMQIMKRQHYVDDYLDSRNTIEDAITTVKKVIKTHHRGGFEMVNWLSNSAEILEILPQNYVSKDSILNLDSRHVERVLGLRWNTQEDILVFDTKFKKIQENLLNGEKTPTKREILKVVMTIFDPIGFLAPLVIQGRILMQECWSNKIEWDEIVNENIAGRWNIWCMALKNIDNFKIRRSYFTVPPLEVDLHIFSDASAKAYSAVAYFVSNHGGNIETSMISSKSKLGPLNKITSIPRMELQGALVASRLGASIQRETNYKIRSVTWWTDSEIVLKWINTRTKRLKSYAAHRVQEIEDLTDITRWRWVPSELNPADYATKLTKFESTMNETWLLGPSFLKQPEDYWPQNKFSSEVPDNAEFVILLKESLTPLPDPHRFSKWLKLIRSTAWILRFCKNIKKSEHQAGQRDFFKKVKLRKGKIPEDMEDFELEVSELENAEKFWWRKIQAQHFEEEINLLGKQEYLSKSSKLYELSPFMDDCGILRMNSRIQYADVAFDIKFPIILPSAKDEITVKMLIQHHHEELKHTGRETVINNLRMRFWIINMRQSVKSITRQCQFCKIKNAKALQPEMSPLPSSRLKPYTRPFSYCGVDYFGPLLVKVKRSTEKRYGVLFTCFNTRAIHIELAASLNTDSALMAIHRMMGRRGQPVELWSDNGTNFVGAENEMRSNLTEMDQERIIRLIKIQNQVDF